MLSYAFRVLKQSNYESVAAESFERVQDLFAAILVKGVARQIKQGLYCKYVEQQASLTMLRGKIQLSETIRNQMQRKPQVVCVYDELSVNNIFHQILKTTMYYLWKDSFVAPKRKQALRKLLVFFDGIERIEPSAIVWNRLYYQRNNKNYEMLLNLCYFVLAGMLQTTERGEYKLRAFSDACMSRLYEKFILEYYRVHHSYLSEIKAAEVSWNLTGEHSETMLQLLPKMRTDVFLRQKEKVLILDAKYYGKTLQKHFDKQTLHSGNLYQIFTYVKNQDKARTGNVAGMLIYAKTQEEITPDCIFNMDGNWIGATTLDLNQKFDKIAAQLDAIAARFFTKE